MKNGIRVVVVMNRKGGCGKSTLVKGLASAAADRGETVTIFDTDASQSCYKWMAAGRAAGNWSPLVEVVPTLAADAVLQTIDEIYEQPDQEHLILIDTFGGGSEAADDYVLAAHLIVTPLMLSRSDVAEAQETQEWHRRLATRVTDQSAVPPLAAVINRYPNRMSEPERATLQEAFETLPVIGDFVLNRAAYSRMDREGLLGSIRDNMVNKGVAAHINDAVAEMSAVLDVLDDTIRAEAN